MKKILVIAAFIFSGFTYQTANAQVSLNLSVNIGSQPEWGPVGYDHVDYYYLPDIDAYYYVPTHQYVYYENNVWVHRTYLPAKYRSYDLYNGYKVVVNRPSPWLKNSYYRDKYASYRGKHNQVIIRDSHDVKYVNHWKGPKGKALGHDKGHHDNGNHGKEHHDNGKHGGGHGHGKH